MKLITGILGILMFTFAAYAADMARGDDKSMENGTTEQAKSATAPAAAPVSGMVARAIITSDVENHEPVDKLTNLTNETNKVYYFTELDNMQGQTVTHRWEYNGKVMAEVPFEIGGPRWRVFSSKNLLPEWTGEWKVSVVAADGGTLATNTFTYNPAPEQSSTPSTMSK